MFGSNLRLVPWKNRDDWLQVYSDAYSDDSSRRSNACQRMELWLLLRNDVPPGVECTLNILSALQQESQQTPRQLQLTLSTSVLRVVNMLCDNARKPGKETIYSIAKYFNLPDWIVNLRHDVSHGASLPDLSSLKKAAVFLLTWLKEYYWEVEKDEMKDIILKRSRYEACKTNVEFYLKIYMRISEIMKVHGDIKIKEIRDKELKLKLLDLNGKYGFKCATECLPWIIHAKDSFANKIPSENIPSMLISEMIKLLLLQLRDYVTKLSFWEVDTIPFIVEHLYQQLEDDNKFDSQLWEPLIQKLNEWNVLDRVLKTLCENKNSAKDKLLMELFSLLCKAVVKRHLVDELKVKLSESVSLAETPTEQAWLNNATLRSRLTLPVDCNEANVLSSLFKRIEKSNADLKGAIQLSNPVTYLVNSCSIVSIIKSLLLRPSTYTIPNLKYALMLGNPAFTKTKKEALLEVVQIYLGLSSKDLSVSSNLKIKTVFDVIKSNRSLFNEQKHNQMETNDFSIKSEIVSQSDSVVERSSWDFTGCPIGVTPWQLEDVDYFHKPFNPETTKPSYVFPISKKFKKF